MNNLPDTKKTPGLILLKDSEGKLVRAPKDVIATTELVVDAGRLEFDFDPIHFVWPEPPWWRRRWRKATRAEVFFADLDQRPLVRLGEFSMTAGTRVTIDIDAGASVESA